MKGYLDKIEDGGKAVILLEEQGFEIIVPFKELPHGSAIGSWFRIYEENGDFSILLDEAERQHKEQLADELTGNLRMKSSGSKYKRD
ncbi:DUF3006 family protein [Planomicrobium sp. MB-3u-38]|uniref:DUF3006 family protein n=1 Tax=Planomicrobium sp. MB-3u-38 TaxID=2058318 RepID=UPI000C7E46E3|nr:DUF3006 family protein [Planomicrobium sp. MB-3u-38]PKH10495.1 DUF3006 domain-containing protein [Planomicrobium sp. MB-3u-38]